MNQDAVEIRKMQPADHDAAMEVLRTWNMAPRTATDTQPDPERSGLDIGRSFVALRGGHVVGVASWIAHPDKLAETASLAVSPDVRGQGVGARLQTARMDEMRQHGFTRLRTETDRPETIRWYIERFGYRKVGANPKKHEFSLTDVDTWTVLEREL